MSVFSEADAALRQPADNLHVCGLVTVATVLVLLIEGLVIGPRGLFLLVAALTVLGALGLIHAAASSDRRPLDQRVARWVAERRPGLRLAEGFGPSILSVLLYCAGLIGAVAAYGYLALANSSIVDTGAEVIEWGLMDKRPLVLGYLVIVAIVVFHWFMRGFFLDPSRPVRPVVKFEEGAGDWVARALGAVLIALLAYWWLCLPALRSVNPPDTAALARFYDLHSHVHLSGFEQIRLGAVPYLEAQTQYGLGNQLLMYAATRLVSFSDHGFLAANVLLNVVGVLGFFILLQQMLGLGWSLVALVGWMLWPSPFHVMDVAGWAILTRWLAIPILSLLLAHALLRGTPGLWTWIAAAGGGTIWGLGSFLSQESLSGGLLVLGLSLALFGPASGWRASVLARFAAIFAASGIVAFVALVSSIVGLSHALDVFRLANAKSGLVMAGVSNSVWSDNLGVSLAFNVVHGRLYTVLEGRGELWPMFQTYGFAVLLMMTVALLAGFLGRHWKIAGERERRFVWKFAGVAVGAYVLHLFTLLRADASHLSGPSFLLPLLLIMLPLFAWRHVERGGLRIALLIAAVALDGTALALGGLDIARRVGEVGGLWRDTAAAAASYEALHDARQPSLDPAARYSPIPEYQAAFRNHRDFAEAQELFRLLRERLHGRPVELGFYGIDALISHPEAFYFFGAFRSVSGITSPKNSIWLRSDEDAWIAKVVSTPGACVFFEPNAKGRLFNAWQQAVNRGAPVVVEPLTGKRAYGTLECKS